MLLHCDGCVDADVPPLADDADAGIGARDERARGYCAGIRLRGAPQQLLAPLHGRLQLSISSHPFHSSLCVPREPSHDASSGADACVQHD